MITSNRSVFQAVALVAVLAFGQCSAFHPSASTPSTTSSKTAVDDRRAFLSKTASLLIGGSIGAGSLLTAPTLAQASGGATAGGAYLLSAKQRYNERVIKGIKGFLALEDSLKSGSVAETAAYFAADSVGTWGDIGTSGYLLANAFRQSANKAPDALPSVKAWKAFVKELDALQKTLKKKDAARSLAAYKSALELLDPYLALVELPSTAELK